VSGNTHRLVLTGASGGLGRAFALALAPQAAGMVLTGRSVARLNRLREAILRRHPHVLVRTVAGDLTEACVRLRVLDSAQSLVEPVDLLVNCAGVTDFREFSLQSAAHVERLIAVDLVAAMQLTQLILPLLVAAPRAQIINIGSILGYVGLPGYAVYCAAKFGLRGFSQALRRELAHTGVRVRYFAPRATRTALNTPAVAALNRELGSREDTPEAVARRLVEFIGGSGPERRLGAPERGMVMLNRLLPGLVDRAIGRKLGTIRKHLAEQARLQCEGGPDR
jgi:short-subunit dehydrogenase